MGPRPDRGGAWFRGGCLHQKRGRTLSASIVCGVDGSPDSQAALELAARLATRLGLRLVVAHVTDPTRIPYPVAAPFGGFAGRYTMMQEVRSQEEEANRLLDGVVVAAGLESAERHTVVGVPAERLADLADEEAGRTDRCRLPWPWGIQVGLSRKRLEQPDRRGSLPCSRCTSGSDDAVVRSGRTAIVGTDMPRSRG